MPMRRNPRTPIFEYGTDVIYDSDVIYVASLGLTTRTAQNF